MRIAWLLCIAMFLPACLSETYSEDGRSMLDCSDESTVESNCSSAELEPIIAYHAHTMRAGESLASVADMGGSTPARILAYNHLAEEPKAGRAIMVPQLAGRDSTLPDERILVMRGWPDKPWVGLGFDCSWETAPLRSNAERPGILEVLRSRGLNTTFFFTGIFVSANPDLAREIVADGHEIANHSYGHPHFPTLGAEEVVRELSRLEELVLETTGQTTRPLFRFPFGEYTQGLLDLVQAEGYLPVQWNLDTIDWRADGSPASVDLVVDRATGVPGRSPLTAEQLPGAIVLAHCGGAGTAQALPRILDRYEALGLEVRPLTEVLGGTRRFDAP